MYCGNIQMIKLLLIACYIFLKQVIFHEIGGSGLCSEIIWLKTFE